MKILNSSIVALTLVFVAGCSAPITKEEQQSMDAPINCATAPSDIRVLNSEKAHAAKEFENGASAIIPIGLVAHLVEGNEKNAFKVGFGEYNKALDEKIAEIKKKCNIE